MSTSPTLTLLGGLLSGCHPASVALVETDTGSPAVVAISDVTWRPHPEIGSLFTVSWRQDAAGLARVEYALEAEDWRTTPPTELGPGGHEVLVLGVPYASDVTVRVVVDNDGGAAHSDEVPATTGPLPAGLPMPVLVAADSTAWEPTAEFLLGSINWLDGGWTQGQYWRFILDRKARVVWAQATPDEHWTIYQRISRDGTSILWDEATWWADFDGGAGSLVHRSKLDGTELETIATPGLHHAFTELDDGTLVWGAADWRDEDLVQRRPGGEVETLWSCREYMREVGEDGECQSNAIFWHEDTDSFLVSFYTYDSILDIDRSTGEVRRVWGQLPGAYDFDPLNSTFWWQHGVTWTEQGTLLTSTYRSRDSSELVVREYEVDDADQTLHEVWSFGEGQGITGETAGEAHRLSGGNTLHNYGSGSRLREVTPNGRVVWDVAWDRGHLLGRSVFLEDLYPLGR